MLKQNGLCGNSSIIGSNPTGDSDDRLYEKKCHETGLSLEYLDDKRGTGATWHFHALIGHFTEKKKRRKGCLLLEIFRSPIQLPDKPVGGEFIITTPAVLN